MLPPVGRGSMVFHPIERLILMLVGAFAVVDVFLAWWKGIHVSVDFFLFSLGIGGLFIAVGQIYRRWRDSERIALTMHAIGLFILFSIVGSLFNVLLLPRPTAPIDATLVQIDAWLGYSWPALCAWVADYPLLNAVLRFAYQLTLAQLFVAFVLLGMSLDRRRLHAGALAMVIAAIAVIFCWAMFPSGGASAYWTLDPEIDRIVRPVVNSEYGALLYRLYEDGVRNIDSLQVTGLIGFPSFHTVMGLISLIVVWPYRAFRITLLVVNSMLAPAILIHGGHNLVDVFGGAIISLATWRVGLAVFDAYERASRQQADVFGNSTGQAVKA